MDSAVDFGGWGEGEKKRAGRFLYCRRAEVAGRGKKGRKEGHPVNVVSVGRWVREEQEKEI